LFDDGGGGVGEDYVVGFDFGGCEVPDEFGGGGYAVAQEDVDFFGQVAFGGGFGGGGVDFDYY
jgi:hypothetical protein